MTGEELFAAVGCAFLFVGLGLVLLRFTRNQLETLRDQSALFLCAFTVRFSLSWLLYGTSLHSSVIGDGDDSGWYGGAILKETWEQGSVSPLLSPSVILGAFQGVKGALGYKYLLGFYFYVTRIPCQVSAAVPSCFAGAMACVFAYRIANSLVCDRTASRVGWWVCFFPVMIIWSCQTIKEPFVVLLELTGLYGCVQLRISRLTVRHVALCGFSVIGLATLRFYAAYVVGLVAVLSLALPHLGRRRFSLVAAVGVLAVAVPVLVSSGSFGMHAEEAEKWDLKRVQEFRHGMVVSADSGVKSNFDMNSSHGLGLATVEGAGYLLLAPFPWQLGGGSVRMMLTAPEMLVWWWLFFTGVLPGLKHTIRHRFGDMLPPLLFLVFMGAIYGLTFGNVGTAYRQRGQLMPYLLLLAAIGREQRKPGRTGSKIEERQKPGFAQLPPLGPGPVALGGAAELPGRSSVPASGRTSAQGIPLVLPNPASRPPAVTRNSPDSLDTRVWNPDDVVPGHRGLSFSGPETR